MNQALLAVIIFVNCISLFLYGFDKYLAVRNEGRISEYSLLIQAALGPFGALLGMMLFRHKIRKLKFFFAPLFILIQIFFLIYYRLL